MKENLFIQIYAIRINISIQQKLCLIDCPVIVCITLYAKHKFSCSADKPGARSEAEGGGLGGIRSKTPAGAQAEAGRLAKSGGRQGVAFGFGLKEAEGSRRHEETPKAAPK